VTELVNYAVCDKMLVLAVHGFLGAEAAAAAAAMSSMVKGMEAHAGS
jgi:hypothetical protein